jgi:hypothetical protein
MRRLALHILWILCPLLAVGRERLYAQEGSSTRDSLRAPTDSFRIVSID